MPIPINIALANVLKRKRESLHLSQEDVSVGVQCNRMTVSMWESGKQEIRLTHLHEVLKIFDMSLVDFFKDVEEEMKKGQ